MILSELFESSEILTCENIICLLLCTPVSAVSMDVEVALLEVRDGAVGAPGECASPAARLEHPMDATRP